MKKWIIMAIFMGICGMSEAQMPAQVTVTNFTIATSSIADWDAFEWKWNARNDQVVTNYFNTTLTNAVFVMALNKTRHIGDTTTVEYIGWTASGNTGVYGTIVSSNVPSAGLYYTELYLRRTNVTPITFFTLAKGKIQVLESIIRTTNAVAKSVSL